MQKLDAADSRTELTIVGNELLDDALALAIVTKDGRVFFGYGNEALLTKDAEDSALIISTIASLLKKRAV